MEKLKRTGKIYLLCVMFLFVVPDKSQAQEAAGHIQNYCANPDFHCVTIGESVIYEEVQPSDGAKIKEKIIRGSFSKLWPDKNEKEIVTRINRTNKRPKKGEVLAVPNNMTDKSYMDFSPFPQKIEPECVPSSERVCKIVCENCKETKGEIKYKKVCEQPCIPVDKLGCGPDGQVFGEKMVIFDKSLKAFGAYDAHGNLVKWGPAYGGSGYCEGEDNACRAQTGNLSSILKQANIAKKNNENADEEPVLEYIRFFRGYGFANSFVIPQKSATHRYVKVLPEDAKWLKKEFAKIGTRVIIKP